MVNVSKTEEKEKEKEKAVSKVLYIGGDTSFYNNALEKFKELYPSVETEFEIISSKDDLVIQSYILKIRELKPKIVMMDFSQNEKAMLHLARVWNRQNFYTKIPIIGLCDYKQSKSVIVKAIMTTVPCIHIKSLEYESLVYDLAVLAFPGKLQNHGFATAEMSDPIHAFHPCKLSLINENFVRIESNMQMKSKQVLRLPNYWARQKIVRSNLMMCVDQSQENIYYNYKFTQVLQMAHADPVEQTDNMSKEDFDIRQGKRQETIDESKYKLKKWLSSNELNSKPKFMKAYVIDKSGCFFDLKPLTDTYSFVFRNQPFILNAKREMTNNKPQLVVYNLEDVDKETLEANADIAHTYNDSRMFQHLVKTIKEVSPKQLPIIIVFNSGEYDSAYMQKVFNYPSILAVKEVMTLAMTLKMVEMLKKKIEPNLPKPVKGDVYIDKNADLSYCEIESDITLLACSENDVYFNSLDPIEENTVLRVSLPVPMYVTVVPIPEYSKITSQYYGIIHGIGEGERKELRRFINSVFFRGLDSDKQLAASERDQLKQKYLNDQVAKKQSQAQSAAEVEESEKKKDQATENHAKEIVDELDSE